VDFESPLTNGRAGGEGSYGDLLTVAGLVGCIPLFLGLLVGVYRLGRLTFANRNCRWLGEAFFTVVLIMIVSIADGWLATVGTVMQYIWVIIGATAVLTSIRCRRS
jgi:hypothetical protein